MRPINGDASVQIAKAGEKRGQLMKAGRHTILLSRRIGYLAKIAVCIFFMNIGAAVQKIVLSAQRMLDACRAVEPRFLEMGDVLQRFYADLNGLIRRVKDVSAKLGGTEEDNIMMKAAQLSTEASRVLDRYCRQATANLDSVNSLVEHLRRLHSACDRIDQIATNLRVVGINIGVECTRSEAARDMFRIVAGEIIEFSDAIVSAGRQIREDAREAVVHEESTRDRISAGLIELKQLAENAAGAIKISSAEAEGCITVARDVFETSGRQFEEISRQVEEIVTAIQFHDNMRQRLEHVFSALADLNGQVGGKRVLLGLSASGVSRLGSSPGRIAVQAGQVRDVIGEIERVHLQSTGAFEKMKSEIGSLVQGMMSVCHMGSKESGRDPFARLIASLQYLVSVVERADRLAVIIDESVTMAVDIAKRFSRHLQKVEKIGVDTHFKAINAVIKSDHLGDEGRTLEVLAREMNTISRETDGFVLFMKEGLNHVKDFAEELNCTSGKEKNDPAGDGPLKGSDGETLARSIEDISAAQVELKDQALGAAEEADGLISGIQDTLDGLFFLPELAAELTFQLEQFERSSTALRPLGGRSELSADPEVFSVADIYTMQRERDVHEAIASGGFPGMDETAGALLSDTPGRITSDDMAPMGIKAPLAEDKAFSALEEREAFGDNVELF